VKLLFGNDTLRAGHAEKQARWQDLLAPLIEPRLPESEHRNLEARAIAAAITCLQAANEEWARLDGRIETFDLYDTAVHAIRRA
jgi:transcriptional regulator MftR-like protein